MDLVTRFFGSFYYRFFKSYVDQTLERKLNIQPSEQLFSDVAKFIVFNQIPGDYLEFGVYDGSGFARAYHYLCAQWKSYLSHARQYEHDWDESFFARMRFFAFDSFEGLPGSTRRDTPVHFAKRGTYAASQENFVSNIQKKGVDISKVVVIPGWFEVTLTEETKREYNLRQASVIFIDCDLYESTVSVLDFVTTLIQDGTVIIFDDFFRYKGHPDKGIRKAFKEWLARNPSISVTELTRCLANRIAFVCHLDDIRM